MATEKSIISKISGGDNATKSISGKIAGNVVSGKGKVPSATKMSEKCGCVKKVMGKII